MNRVGDPPVDGAVLAMLWGGGAGEELAALNQFLELCVQDAGKLRDAFEHRSGADILAACHRIIGAGWTVGANQLTLACEEIQAGARDGDWSGVAAALPEFERQLGLLAGYIGMRNAER